MNQRKDWPEALRRATDALLVSLEAASPDPEALVVYGPAARGDVDVGRQEIHLAVVVKRASREVLHKLHAPLRGAWRAARFEPFVVERGEVARLGDSFPIKALEIGRHGVAIHGDNPFASVSISDAHLRARVEQELRNHLMRLRRHALFAGDEGAAFAQPLHRSAQALPQELEALLYLTKRPAKVPRGELFDQAAAAFDLDRTVLRRIVEFEVGGEAGEPEALFYDLISLLERAVAVVDGLEDAS
jgi:hypothetical protein